MTLPDELQSHLSGIKLREQDSFASSASEVFEESRNESSSTLYNAYKNFILDKLKQLESDGHKFGALIIEPVVLGAGGMIFW